MSIGAWQLTLLGAFDDLPLGTEVVRPHVIRCLLHRSKVDVNRDLGEAAFGNAEAGLAWKEYHDFIDEAKLAINNRTLYIDVHGQVSASNSFS